MTAPDQQRPVRTAPEPDLDLGLNEVFAAGWGTNAVKANLDENPPKHKSCMTTQFGSVAFRACAFKSGDEVGGDQGKKNTFFFKF